MATAFKSLDYTVPFNPNPQPSIRVAWSATTAVDRALAHDLEAQKTLEELAIADLARGAIATARHLLSAPMFEAFLRSGEAASRVSTHYDTDQDGCRLCDATSTTIAAVAEVVPQNPHDIAFKTYLWALEATDSPSFGPLEPDDGTGDTTNGAILVRGLGDDLLPKSPLVEQIDTLSLKAFEWSGTRLSWTTSIGTTITSTFIEAQRLLADEGTGTGPKSLNMSAYDMWMRGPLLAWNRRYERYVDAATALGAYDRDVHTPTFAEGSTADEATCVAVQDRYDDLCRQTYDELDALWRLPAPGPAELATKMKLFRERGGAHQSDAEEYVDQLVIDARRFGRQGPHLQTDQRLLAAFAGRRREFETNYFADMSRDEENAYFERIDNHEAVLHATWATTIEGVVAKLRVGFAGSETSSWSDFANGDVSRPEFREGLDMADMYHQLIWSAIEDLARIGGVNLSEQGA